jgi:membrane protease YdiL (CAAX protease family)
VIGAALFTLAALAEPVALQALRSRQGAAPVPLRLVWAIPLVLWLLPLFFVQALFARSVECRGRHYTLGLGGRLRGVRMPAMVLMLAFHMAVIAAINDTDFNVAAFDRRSRGWCF